MQRSVQPELLDALPPEDPRAIRSRRDLRRVNVLMRSHTIMASALQIGTKGYTPRQIVDLGAGDGDFLLRVARRLMPALPARFMQNSLQFPFGSATRASVHGRE